jgi:hypothetical protein
MDVALGWQPMTMFRNALSRGHSARPKPITRSASSKWTLTAMSCRPPSITAATLVGQRGSVTLSTTRLFVPIEPFHSPRRSHSTRCGERVNVRLDVAPVKPFDELDRAAP